MDRLTIVMFPWLAHGHISPYLELAKRLSRRNFVVHLCSTAANFNWVNTLKKSGNLIELVDSRLGSDFNNVEAMTAINVGLHCTNAVAAERPSMSTVVSMLEGTAGVQHFASDTNVSVGKVKAEEAVEVQSISTDVPLTVSSASTADLYPLTVDTEYWEKRDL